MEIRDVLKAIPKEQMVTVFFQEKLLYQGFKGGDIEDIVLKLRVSSLYCGYDQILIIEA